MRFDSIIVLSLILLFPICLKSQPGDHTQRVLSERTAMPRHLVLEEADDVFKVRLPEIQTAGMPLIRYAKVIGGPYLDKEFKFGKLIMKGDPEKDVKMRYDAYRDDIQIIQNEKQMYLVKNEDIEAIIEGKRYQYRNYLDNDNVTSGYLIPLNTGNTKLYSRITKYVTPPRLPVNGYDTFQQPEFKIKIIYYIKREGKTATPLQDLSRKEVFAVLWDKYSELRKYARKNKLHLRTEEEVVHILEYYDKLKAKEDNIQPSENGFS